MKLHFTYRQSDSRLERYTNAELADMHLACKTLILMEEPRSGSTPNVNPNGRHLATPSLHDCARGCLVLYPSSWTHRYVSEDTRDYNRPTQKRAPSRRFGIVTMANPAD
ncbi:hypothetical protein TNCV_323001 [Trichonephila clavipes]|nr:hypothetical protein TNCV_323001 [Trichonephila clavipes]